MYSYVLAMRTYRCTGNFIEAKRYNFFLERVKTQISNVIGKAFITMWFIPTNNFPWQIAENVSAVAGCTSSNYILHSYWSILTTGHAPTSSLPVNGRVHAKSLAHGKIADSSTFFEFSQTRIAVRSPWRLNGVFYGDSLRCVVIREQFVGLSRLQSPVFLRWSGETTPRTTLNQKLA